MPGQGTPQHLLIEYFSRLAGIKIQAVPFRGGNQALTELLGKRLDFLIDPPIALLGQIKSGALHAIAVTGGDALSRSCRMSAPSPRRASPASPSPPGWAWSRRPKLPAADRGAAQRRDRRAGRGARGGGAHPRAGQRAEVGPPEDFRNRIAADIARWTKVIADAGIERI